MCLQFVNGLNRNQNNSHSHNRPNTLHILALKIRCEFQWNSTRGSHVFCLLLLQQVQPNLKIFKFAYCRYMRRKTDVNPAAHVGMKRANWVCRETTIELEQSGGFASLLAEWHAWIITFSARNLTETYDAGKDVNVQSDSNLRKCVFFSLLDYGKVLEYRRAQTNRTDRLTKWRHWRVYYYVFYTRMNIKHTLLVHNLDFFFGKPIVCIARTRDVAVLCPFLYSSWCFFSFLPSTFCATWRSSRTKL